jgi:hypothetical protein
VKTFHADNAHHWLGWVLLLTTLLVACESSPSKGTSTGSGSAAATSDSVKSAPVPVTQDKDAGRPIVEGLVFKDGYDSQQGSDLPYQYYVSVKVVNAGKTALRFDNAEGLFMPVNGKPLSEETHPTSSEFGVIAPGKSQEFDYVTDGYTRQLLENANPEPLRFGLGLMLKGKLVVDPVVADLPSIADEKLPFRGTGAGLKLRFSAKDPTKPYLSK